MTDLRPLVLPLNGIYFDQIKAGDKPEEFRLITPFWSKRLVGREFSHVELTRGYPARGDKERRLKRQWRGYRTTEITHPHFGDKTVDVFAIDVSVPLCPSL